MDSRPHTAVLLPSLPDDVLPQAQDDTTTITQQQQQQMRARVLPSYKPPDTSVGPNHKSWYDDIRDDNVVTGRRQPRPPAHFYLATSDMPDDASAAYDAPSIKNALIRDDASQWKIAIAEEWQQLQHRQTFTTVTPPAHANVISSKFVLRIKRKPDGSVDKYKARLVARGFTQQQGVDYDQTFGPVAILASVRFVIALACTMHWTLATIDFTGAYLNANIDAEIYMSPPPGTNLVPAGQVCKLHKSIYGLKQSAFLWHAMLHDTFVDLGFTASAKDACVFYNASKTLVATVYVDDVLLGGSSTNINTVIAQIRERFEITAELPATAFLGMAISMSNDTMSLTMPGYVDRALAHYGMSEAAPSLTPLPSGLVIDTPSPPISATVFKSFIGTTQYLALHTRPDIAYAINLLSQQQANPTEYHWALGKHVLRYLKGTPTLGLHFVRNRREQQQQQQQQQQSMDIFFFSDANHGDPNIGRRSTSSYLAMLSGAPFHWRVKKQNSIALSSTEAEFVSLSECFQDAIWIQQLAKEVCAVEVNIVVYGDNQGAIKLLSEPKQTQKLPKHIDVRYLFVRESIATSGIPILYMNTTDMIADILTKSLPAPRFAMLRSKMNLK